MTREDWEDLIEQAYWELDTLQCSRNMVELGSISDRDLFKMALRMAYNKVIGSYESL